MNLKSLGIQTDLIFPEFEGEVTDCGDYIRIRTPSNPNFWYGNCLLFAKPPSQETFERWMRLFKEEIGEPPEVEHMVFLWDISEQEANLTKFQEAGFSLEETVVMTAGESSLKAPRKKNEAIDMRVLTTEAEFAEFLDLEALVDVEQGYADHASHRLFLERKLERYRRMTQAGLGQWFGAYLDGKLVAYMGLYKRGELARYQTVATHPEYRRQGIAQSLVYFVGRYGFDEMGVKQLVMQADDNYFAKNIYADVGFKPTEKIYALERRPAIKKD